MKTLYTFIFLLLVSVSSYADTYYTYTATKSGSWNDMSIWSIAVRTDGVSKTKAVIPSPYIVTADNAVNNLNLGDIQIYISGTLAIQASTNLLFTSGSSITLVSAGRITGTASTQKITLGGVVKYNGSLDLTKTGASIANSTTSFSPNGFSAAALLPVVYSSFTVVKNGNAVIVSWSTSSEISNDHFEVERSYNGAAWVSVAAVKAIGTSASANNYSYTDNNASGSVIYYRLKQTDIDGAVSYSVVKTISSANAAGAKMYAAGKTINIEFNTEIKNTVVVTVMNTNGQLLERKQFSAGYKITLDESNKQTGILVVNVTDGAFSQTAKLML